MKVFERVDFEDKNTNIEKKVILKTMYDITINYKTSLYTTFFTLVDKLGVTTLKP